MSTIEGEVAQPEIAEKSQSTTPQPLPASSRHSGTKNCLADVRNLTPKQERAAALVADDGLSDREIAKKLKIEVSTLTRWKATNPEFRKRVGELTQALREKIEDQFLTEGLARRGFRLQSLNDIHMRMRTVMDERAADPDLQQIPGGKTGIVVLRKKALGSGNNFEIVEESEVDTALLREFRAVQRDAAEELGQLQPKSIMPLIQNGAGSAPVFQIVFVDPPNASGSQSE